AVGAAVPASRARASPSPVVRGGAAAASHGAAAAGPAVAGPVAAGPDAVGLVVAGPVVLGAVAAGPGAGPDFGTAASAASASASGCRPASGSDPPITTRAGSGTAGTT